jgi:hypothetical protein
MRGSIFALSTVVTVALLALFFGTLTAAAAQPDDVALSVDTTTDLERANHAIVAFRAISVPFTLGEIKKVNGDIQVEVIASPSSEDNDAIFCPEGADIKVRVSLRQDSARAHTRGYVTGDTFKCPAEDEQKSMFVHANTIGRSVFEPGQAVDACAWAIVYPKRGGAIVSQWCPDPPRVLK